MKLFDLLGAPVAYDKELNDFTDFNRDGLYEYNMVSVNGEKDVRLFENKIVKVVFSGLYPNIFNSYTGLSRNIIENSTLLVCLRKPLGILNSINNIFLKNNKNDDFKNYPFNYLYSEYRYFFTWLKDNMWILNHMVVFDTEDYFKDPENAVETLKFISESNATRKQFEYALATIGDKTDVDLEIPSNCVKMFDYCNQMYEYMLDGNFDAAVEFNWEFKL